MKNKSLCVLLLFAGSFLTVRSQVKIGNNPGTINANAVLDVESTTKGILLPRLGLTSTGSASPLSAHVAGMLVYNTATANDVAPGLYYNDGGKWVQFVFGMRQGFGATFSAGTQLLATGSVYTKVQFTTEEWDLGNVFTPGAANSQFIVQTAGKYTITGSVFLGSVTGNSNRSLAIYKNGSLLALGDGALIGSNNTNGMTVAYIASLAVGDIIELRAANSGANTPVITNGSFSAIKAD
jgi:hypothetical protein